MRWNKASVFYPNPRPVGWALVAHAVQQKDFRLPEMGLGDKRVGSGCTLQTGVARIRPRVPVAQN